MIKLFKNVQVYSPDDLGTKDILVIGDKISSIADTIEPSEMMQIIDATGLIVTPGLIDQHVHIIGGGGEGGFTTRVPEVQLSEITRNGITTVVGLLGTDVYTRSIENLLAKTKALNEEGISAYCLTGGYKFPSVTLTDSIEKDIVFISEIIGLKLAISDHRGSSITYDELKRTATKVRLASMMSNKQGYIHLHIGKDPSGLDIIFKLLNEMSLPVSLFRPTHVHKIYEDAIKFANLGGIIDFTADITTERLNQLAEAISSVPKGNVTLSSDSNGSLPQWNDKKEVIGMDVSRSKTLLETIKELIKMNVKPSDVIALCTENVAKSIGLYPRKGTISINSDADLTFFDHDFNVKHVVAKGSFLIKDNKYIVKGTFERGL